MGMKWERPARKIQCRTQTLTLCGWKTCERVFHLSEPWFLHLYSGAVSVMTVLSLLFAKSCLTLCGGFSVCGISQARILEWVAISYSKGSSQPRDHSLSLASPALVGRFVTTYLGSPAAKSLQSCPTLCDPIDGSPPGSSVHGIFQARVLEWDAITFSTWEVLWRYKFNKFKTDFIFHSLNQGSIH